MLTASLGQIENYGYKTSTNLFTTSEGVVQKNRKKNIEKTKTFSKNCLNLFPGRKYQEINQNEPILFLFLGKALNLQWKENINIR